jgi:hypothetical protein
MTMSFIYRDLRLALVKMAVKSLQTTKVSKTPIKLTVKDPKISKLSFTQLAARAALEALKKEQAELAEDRYEVSDEFAGLLGAAWVWDKTIGLVDAEKQDPAIKALKQEPLLPAKAAIDIQNLPRTGVPDVAFFDRVLKTAGENAGAELAGIALGEWLRADEDKRRNPVRDVAVMLPLRLETLFKQDKKGGWRLLLRVTPDEPSIQRHEMQLSQDEADFLIEFWERSVSLEVLPDTVAMQWLSDQDDGMVAWLDLCNRVGAARAAWLVAEFPPVMKDGRFVCTVPGDRIGDNPPPQIWGLPPELVITAFHADGSQLDIGTLAPQAGCIALVMPGTDSDGISTDPDNPTGGNWLTDWEAAKKVGLGGEFALPAGADPETLASLYVYGVGEEKAADLFAGHGAGGTLGLLKVGAPTNSIEGAAAADLSKDNAAWRQVAYNRLAGERGNGIAAVARSLCGAEDAIADVPGGTENTALSRQLAKALWPALWGHWFRDIWGCMDDAHELWGWANNWLAPEGPLAPLRLDSQPYGLLPVMALEQWQPAGDGFDAAEERLVNGLVQLLPQWAHAAEGTGTVTGTDEAGLLALLGRTGVSGNYDYRTFRPPEVVASIVAPGAEAEFKDIAAALWKPATGLLGKEPAKSYLAMWGAQPLTLPLIGAQRMPEMRIEEIFHHLYELEGDRFADMLFDLDKRRTVADSLLIRLMIWSAVAAKAWYMQSFQAPEETLVNPTYWSDPPQNSSDVTQQTPLEFRQREFWLKFKNGEGTKPVAELVKAHRETILDLASLLSQFQKTEKDPYDSSMEVGVLALPVELQTDLERALRATLDTAAHRIDAWATGVASHRLSVQLDSGLANHRLGAYGWLDGPFLGEPGPNQSGRLHAPSYTQALTAIILRDKYLSTRDQSSDSDIWRTELDSAGVRMAIDIAREIRLGFHIYEVVGRRVEEIVAGRDQIALLRGAKPLRPERPDPRDVCQGVDALAALLGAGIAGVLATESGKYDDQMKRLTALNAGLDAFADLLLAEGVHNVVGGHADLAANAMDAAAGFARPPDFEVVKTPPSGYRLATSVVSAIPYVTPVKDGTALELADSSLASFLSNRFGAASLWTWKATWQQGDANQAGEVPLADLGLSPLQAMLIPEDFLAEVVRTTLGQPFAKIDPANGHRLMCQAAGLLATQPALAADISAVPDDAADGAIDADILKDLLDRYGSIHAACVKLADGPAQQGSAAAIAFLRTALGWGIVGQPQPALRQALIDAVFGTIAPEPETLAALVEAVKGVFQSRLDKVNDSKVDVTLSPSPSMVARAIADLVQPNGRLAITGRWPVAAFLERTAIRKKAEAKLDTEWLPVVAVVRPTLARLEGLQLEASILGGFEPMTAWTAAPAGDPWRTGLVAGNKATRDEEISKLVMTRLVNAYGDAGAFGDGDVAVGLLDQFSEAVPMAKRATYAAFGFNAPAARAPQAILLGVPPRPDHRLEATDMLQVLIETRRLAHARAARLEDGASNPIAPSAWLQASGPLRVMLSGVQFTR